MPRPANIIRPSHLKTSLPEDLRARLDLHLWSASEGRVPMGAYQQLIVMLLTQYLDRVEALQKTVKENELLRGTSL